MNTSGTLYRTATVTVRQFHLNANVWALTWKAGSEWTDIKDRLKELLWAFDYKYDSNSKSWLISKAFTRQLENILVNMFLLENINWPGNDTLTARQAGERARQRADDYAREQAGNYERERKSEEERTRRQREQDERDRQRREQEQRQRSYSTPNNQQTDPYAVLMVTRSAPLDLCEVVYRYWAKALHPDKGGSHEKMKAVNNAIAEIRRVKGK